MLDFVRRHKVLSMVLFLNVILVLVAILIVTLHLSKTATVDIMVAPSEAVVELNGVSYGNQQAHDVRPGNYHVKISMAGMQTKEYDLELVENEFARIRTYLVDENGGFSYYVEHPEDMEILEDVADAEAKEFLEEYGRLHAIVDVLPLTYANTFDENATEVVSISIEWGTGSECKEKPYCLVVHDYTGKNTEKALDMIRKAGYNPDDFEIVLRQGEA